MYRKNFMRSEPHICGNMELGEDAELSAGEGIVPDGARKLVFGGEIRKSGQGAQGAIGIALGVRLGDAEVAVAAVAFGSGGICYTTPGGCRRYWDHPCCAG